ncbi:MAG: hypothetical protein GXY38_08410 [Planctomycetes bacterium]|jgi:hypothetical protein|nr:hypothetical protein [Planctomycetota bacterium]
MLLSHANRQRKAYVLTLDEVLAEDVTQRLGDLPRAVSVVTPQCGPKATVRDIEAIAPDTVRGSLIIFDVRSLTLPLLQHVFNKVVGYNRRDFNERCFSIVIGDGPADLIEGGTLGAFARHLGKFRIDYSPKAYFFDPFLHYAPHEKPSGLDEDKRLLDQVPVRLLEGFQGDVQSVGQIRRYFRAAAHAPLRRTELLPKRTEILRKFFAARLQKMFPAETQYAKDILSPRGLRLGDETLSVHLYPIHFEDYVSNLLDRSNQASARQ